MAIVFTMMYGNATVHIDDAYLCALTGEEAERNRADAQRVALDLLRDPATCRRLIEQYAREDAEATVRTKADS